jgi:phosphoenolpyruvate carboxykinase (GTP)
VKRANDLSSEPSILTASQWGDLTFMDEQNFAKLRALNDGRVLAIVERYVNLCKPSKVTVITDAEEDIEYVRRLAIQNGEEIPLATEGHTVHFDGLYDQGRDPANTRVLVREGQSMGEGILTGDRETCLAEIFSLLDGAMAGKEMFILFFCLGPIGCKLSIPALQITDSAYVAHSETILYRPGYEEFKRLAGSGRFFHFVHSAGELENGVSKNVDKRRIYIDLEENRVLTVNNQYAGNSVGLKKLGFRLAINEANKADWLAEHMFLMGAIPLSKDRRTYFAGAFPSACGKTSTAMIPGQAIVGDDIIYMWPGEDGQAYAVNIEQGIFGILEDVNPVDDPLIYKALTTPGELIFSNVLVKDGRPYWLGMGIDLPDEGFNYAGHWRRGDRDKNGKAIPPAHKNARYTLRLSALENVDSRLHDPAGIPVSGIIYGGRDSDTNPPVLQSFDWPHGVFVGASLESETTAATVGRQIGVRKHDAMAIMDFLVVPLGTYIANHLRFGERLVRPPKVFAVNYFLREDGVFLNQKVDKKVWLMWMEGRIHDEYGAIKTPIGWLPTYEDVRSLFQQVFAREYRREDYEKQFAIRVTKQLEKLDRIEAIYRKEVGVPEALYEQVERQRERLLAARESHRSDIISPFAFA